MLILLVVSELSALFKDMITSNDQYVKPTLKLASSTLIRPEILRRRSTVGGASRPMGLGEINGETVQGPSLPPIAAVDEKAEESSTAKADDSSSDITLVGDVHTPESDVDDVEMVDIKNTQASTADMDGAPGSRNDSVVTGTEDKNHTKEEKQKNEKSTDEAAPPSRPPPVPPRPKLDSKQTDLLQEVEFAAKQQDVTEVIDNVLFQIECAMKPTSLDTDGEQVDLIKDLFYGKLKWTYDPTRKQKIDNKVEIFNTIIVNVSPGPRDIYTALDEVFDMHKVMIDGKYVPRFGTIEQIPPFVQVNVQRVGFDREKGTAFKVENHLQLPDTIYMDRYMHGDGKLLSRRKATWEWKEELRQLEAKRDQLTKTPVKDAKLPDVIDATWEFVSKIQADGESQESSDLMDIDPLNVNGELGTALQSRGAELEASLKSLDTRIAALRLSIADQFDGMEAYGYRLHALFIHRGSAGAGHYWIYIRDFNRGIWLKYNDENVDEEANLDTIFKPDPRSPSQTPYFLVYVRQGQEGQLVDSLCRAPVKEDWANIVEADMVEQNQTGEPEVIEGVDADAFAG